MVLTRNGMVAALLLALPLHTLADGKDEMETRLNIGASLTEGNSETKQIHAALIAEGERPALGSLRIGVEAHYGEARIEGSRERNVENVRAFANARKTLTDMFFLSLDGSVLHDSIADVDYRFIVGPGAGLYLLKTDRTGLSLETGPSYVWEQINDQSDHYLALRFSQRLTQALSDTAKLRQSAEYIPEADDFDNYLFNADIGLEAALNARLNMNLTLKYAYDSTPGDDQEKSDFSLVAGIGVRL